MLRWFIKKYAGEQRNSCKYKLEGSRGTGEREETGASLLVKWCPLFFVNPWVSNEDGRVPRDHTANEKVEASSRYTAFDVLY
jgi:hypothetical protein